MIIFLMARIWIVIIQTTAMPAGHGFVFVAIVIFIIFVVELVAIFVLVVVIPLARVHIVGVVILMVEVAVSAAAIVVVGMHVSGIGLMIACVWTGTISSGAVVDAIGIVLAGLASCAVFLVLASFHFCLFKKSSFFRCLLAFLTILDFVLSDQCIRRNTINVLVLAELADPHIFRFCSTVPILILLLFLSIQRLQGVFFRGIATWSRLGWRCVVGTRRLLMMSV